MTLPPGSSEGAGTVAVSAGGAVIVWSPADAAPAYSTDSGHTWTAVSGLPQGDVPVADPVHPDVFYAYDTGTGTLLESTDGGATFSAETTGLPGRRRIRQPVTGAHRARTGG